jgi:heterodisulfide reductase subunit C
MDMDHTPRQLFAMIRAGMRREVCRSNTPWMCVSCYYCTVRCPQEIRITDVMYTLKNMATRDRLYTRSTAPDFSKAFIANVENYGRSFEVGLTARHYLRHYFTRLPAMAPMGIGLLRSGRMGLLPPKRINGMAGLRRILAKAKELEASS